MRRHRPKVPVDRDGNAVIIPFPGVQLTTDLMPSDGFESPTVEWVVCDECGEDVMAGDICVWCEDD